MAELQYRIHGMNAEEIAKEIETLRQRSSTFRAIEAAAIAKGYQTIDINMNAGVVDPKLSIADSFQGQTGSDTWNIEIDSNATGSWGVGGRQVTVGELIAHELAHSVVPPANQDPPGVIFTDGNGPAEMWVRQQTGNVANELGFTGLNNGDVMVTVIPVSSIQAYLAVPDLAALRRAA
jgi:hypothetical protein